MPDECVRGRILWAAMRRLVASRKIDQVVGWKPGGRFTYDDPQVVNLLTSLFCTIQHVVILTADRRGNLDGLRPILHRAIKPLLQRSAEHGLSLTVLVQRPGTTELGFAWRCFLEVRDREYLVGFHDKKL